MAPPTSIRSAPPATRHATAVTRSAPRSEDRPLVIAHRGASGYLPEHTLAAYALAVAQGADYIEPDLVATRDGVLVARHENDIGTTTDVAARFPDRRTTRLVDGIAVTGWFTEDLTLAELKTLRARERLPFRSGDHDGHYPVPTLEEILDLVARLDAETGRRIGLYPETKHPSYFRQIGLPLEEPLIAALEARGYRGPTDPVFIQSFETANLRWLRQRTRLRLVQLLDQEGAPWDWREAGRAGSYADMLTPAGLHDVAGRADGIGPHKHLIVPWTPAGDLDRPTSLVNDAHAAGLLVHPWTFRSDPEFLHPAYGASPEREIRQYLELGVDGVFADFPDVAVRARDGSGPREPAGAPAGQTIWPRQP